MCRDVGAEIDFASDVAGIENLVGGADDRGSRSPGRTWFHCIARMASEVSAIVMSDPIEDRGFGGRPSDHVHGIEYRGGVVGVTFDGDTSISPVEALRSPGYEVVC